MAITLRRRPRGHCSRSSANARRKKSAHGSRRERDELELELDDAEPGQLEVAASSASVAGTRARSFARCLLAGPNTPA